VIAKSWLLAGQNSCDSPLLPPASPKLPSNMFGDRGFGFCAGFAMKSRPCRGQAIRALITTGMAKSFSALSGIGGAGGADIAGGRDIGAGRTGPCKAFEALSCAAALVGGEDENTGGAQLSFQGIDQRCFRTTERPGSIVLVAAKQDHGPAWSVMSSATRSQLLRRCRIAGRRHKISERRGLRQLPGQGMFAATERSQDYSWTIPSLDAKLLGRERQGDNGPPAVGFGNIRRAQAGGPEGSLRLFPDKGRNLGYKRGRFRPCLSGAEG